MKLKFILALLVLTGYTATVKAQDNDSELITDRPDQTESSAVVPHKSLQIETGFLMENTKTSLFDQKSFVYNTTLLRYGLLKNFELRLGLEYLGEKEKINSTGNTNTTSGLSPLYTGFKVKIADENGWKPEVAFLGGLVLPFTADEDFKTKFSAADIRFAFSHTLSDKISFGYNLGAEWDGETAIPAYFYSIALGTGITDKLGAFIENYGWLPEMGKAEHLIDAGFTYLIRPNLQLDVSGGLGLQNSIDSFMSLGLSYRLPN
ncbi:transporter [Sunxiuqinia sp. A32]|uniref:transporter n=1 Tax=Sunxiuqinia sp. A32 TaxID=3461496 RepID=UPI004045B5C1